MVPKLLAPVFPHICAQGHDSELTKELAQSFFERIFSKGVEKTLPKNLSGAFRAYLMRSVKNFLTDYWRYQQARRRGGGTFAVSP